MNMRTNCFASFRRGILLLLAWLTINYKGVTSTSCQSQPCLYFSNSRALQAIDISSSNLYSVVSNLDSIDAVDVHVRLNLVYWSERRPNAIKRLNITSGKVENVSTDSNIGQIKGIAVEWESGLIYWTDYTNRRIEVAQLDGKNRRILISKDIRNPLGIAVDPRRGYMFWLTGGLQRKIERASLAGEDRKTLVNLGTSLFYVPNGMTIDFQANRIYYLERGFFSRKLESIDFDGNTRQQFMSLSSARYPYDIVLLSGVFYVSDARGNKIHKIEKSTKRSLGNYAGLGFSNLQGLGMFSSLRQPKGSSACHNNSGCSHLCLLSPAGSQCACPIGSVLKPDGKTCDDSASKLLLFVDKTQRGLYQIPLGTSISKEAMALPLDNVRRPVGVDFDPVNKYVYWSDSHRDVISRVHLNGSAQEKVVDRLRTPNGIAIDYIARNLYWTDEGSNRIEVSKLDGSFKKALVYSDLWDPLDIVLDVEKGYMYWSQEGSSSIDTKIERADMDGMNRIVVKSWNYYSHNIRSPNGLALDKEQNRLYYFDDHTRRIYYVSLSTGRESTLLDRTGYPKGTVVHGSYIYWTETQGRSGAVYRADKKSGRNVERVVSGLIGPEDICVYDANDTLLQKMKSNCSRNNGGCSHLCLLTPVGHRCACPNEMNLKPDGKTCHFSEFLLFADSTRKKIYLINIDNQHSEIVPLELDNLQEPEALDFDPQTHSIYWSDLQLRQIARANPDGKSKAIVVSSGIQRPRGIAVDYAGRNLYWTDYDANRIEVAKLDGSQRKVLISRNIEKPVDIVLDLENGLMYWSSWSNREAKIEQASMDGSNRSTVVLFLRSWWHRPANPNGLALDPETSRLYWVDTTKSLIQYTDLGLGDGSITTLPVPSYYLTNAYGLTLKETTLYWSTSGSIYAADKKTGGNVRRLVRNMASPRDVHAYHNYSAIPGDHPCSLFNGWCTHLCLLKPGGYQCACPTDTGGIPCKTTPVIPPSSSLSSLPSRSPSPSPSSSPLLKSSFSSTSPSILPSSASSKSPPQLASPSSSSLQTQTWSSLPSPSVFILPLTLLHTLPRESPSYLSPTSSSPLSTSLVSSSHTSVIPTLQPPVDACMSNPCKNGGTCLKGNKGSYTCRCSQGYTWPHCELYIADNNVSIAFEMKTAQWNQDTFRKSIAKAFTEYCTGDQRPCKLHKRLNEITTRSASTHDDINAFRPEDVLVLGRHSGGHQRLFSIVLAVLVPEEEQHQSSPRQTISAALLCQMVVKTSKLISEYMDNVEIVLINGEKEPSCASNPGEDGENESQNEKITGSKERNVDGQHEERLSSGATAGIVLGIIVVIIFGGVVFVAVRSRGKALQIFKTPFTTSFNNPGFEPYHSDLNDDNSGGASFSIPEPYEVARVPSSNCERQFQNLKKSFYKQETANPLYSAKCKEDDSQSSAANPIYDFITEQPRSGDPKGASTESNYVSLAKQEMHRDGNRNEEPLYAQPCKVELRSACGSKSLEAQNGNPYARLGSGSCSQQPRYAPVGPSSPIIHQDNNKGVGPRKGIFSEDHFWPGNTVHPENSKSHDEKPVADVSRPRPRNTGYPANRLADENCSKEKINDKEEALSTTSRDNETPVLHLPTELGPEETTI